MYGRQTTKFSTFQNGVACRKLSRWGSQPSNFHNIFTSLKTSVIGLAFGENHIIIGLITT